VSFPHLAQNFLRREIRVPIQGDYLQFNTTEYGRSTKVIASEEIKAKIQGIGINKCARESRFDRKNFIRKLIRGIPVKRNSYNEFVRWLQSYELQKLD
jgi:hypothetical protein